jgi:hypothetical protein
VIGFIIKLISIVVLTFALALIVLGVITMWLSGDSDDCWESD